MKATFFSLRVLVFAGLIWPAFVQAQIPVTDAANLANNRALHVESMAKWAQSIEKLRMQIDQLNREINIQSDIRRWSGNPAEAGAKIVLRGMGREDLVREYGNTKTAVLDLVGSLDSLNRTAHGDYRVITSVDIDGNAIKRDPLTYRRYSVLDAIQANSDEVTDETTSRQQQLQGEIATTLEQLKGAPTQAEAQKLSAKLTALNGQLAETEAIRRRHVDAVVLQKIANDSRREQERVAAAELAEKDDYLANKRASAFLNGVHFRNHPPQ